MKRETFNLFVVGVCGMGTLAGVLLMSGAKKVAQKSQEPSFEERMAAFERKR